MKKDCLLPPEELPSTPYPIGQDFTAKSRNEW